MIALLSLPTLSSSYWRDARIHNFGNVGPGGWVHALLAPAATKLIDHVAYSGHDVRAQLWREVPDGVVDLCCGVGLSTHPNASVGIDTSAPFLSVARVLHPEKRFAIANAETWGDPDCVPAATLFFALHEMPREGRAAVLRNALRVARSTVLVADIAIDYTPSQLMLSGEPFLLDYLAHADHDVNTAAAEAGWAVDAYRRERCGVSVWTLRPL